MAYHRGDGAEASAATGRGAAAARVRVGLEVEARERCYIAGLGFRGCIYGSGPRTFVRSNRPIDRHLGLLG